jgi:hemoglobin
MDHARRSAMTDSVQTRSLFERLGGIDGIAVLMNVLTERLFDNVSANRNPYVQAMHDKVSRAGFKFMVTAWSIEETGGPKCYPGRDMRAAHANMVVTERDWQVVVLEIAATLSYCGVLEQEAEEYLVVIERYKDQVVSAGHLSEQAS